MKIIMDRYNNDMCDHMVELTSHCHYCEGIYRTPGRSFLRRLASIINLTIAAWRTL